MCGRSSYWVLGIWYWVFGTGYWIFGTGYWVFGAGGGYSGGSISLFPHVVCYRLIMEIYFNHPKTPAIPVLISIA